MGSRASVKEYFESNISRDFFDAVCGDFLGSGIGRNVFICAVNPGYVVKVETGTASFQNAVEWEFWEEMKDKPIGRKWLAPCYRISPCGLILIQRKTSPIPTGYKLPKKVPLFLGDMKTQNYGLLDGKLVAHDYGRSLCTLVWQRKMNGMRNAKWWDANNDKTRSRAA